MPGPRSPREASAGPPPSAIPLLRLAEHRLLTAIKDELTATEVQYVLGRVEEEVRRLLSHLPEEIKLRRAALAEEERRVANFIEFIGDGKTTPALFHALQPAEEKVINLKGGLRALEASAADVFEAPPTEWVADRLTKIGEVLEGETVTSALVLRRTLGPVRLTPGTPQVGRPYYQAETAVRVLELIETPDGGSDSLHLVEAVGIEPTSGNPRQQASTSIADLLLLSPPGPPTGWISGQPAPQDLAPHPGAGLGASHQSMTP